MEYAPFVLLDAMTLFAHGASALLVVLSVRHQWQRRGHAPAETPIPLRASR